ncbi:XRE family transcriptional regulator [Paraburkholderia sp. J69-2]|uniref:helix-turn-helix domain-containing protein n=2 Tax=unclassified Paraburkholderia TaxID=2615204 RepID=UPI002AAF7711|nr:XRE family transcriptional regulator [Paraburkholderia sp. J69-2]
MQSIIGYMKEQPKTIVGKQLSSLMESVPSLGTQQKLAAKTGIGQTTIGRIRRGEVNATLDNLKRIAEAFNVPVSYLYGETDVHGLTPEERAVVLSRTEKEILEPNVAQGPDIRGKLPLISWVQAGNWTEVIDNFAPGDAEDWIPCPFNHGPNAFVLRVVGESNYDPTGPKSYAPGDFIAVDPAREPTNRSMVVVRVDHEDKATFKQLLMDDDGTMMLKALNPNWPQRIFAMPKGSRIVGIVIGKWIPE